MHLVDFLPASNWNDPVVMNDPYLKLFQDLRQYLEQNGRLEAQVGFDAPIQGGPVGSFPKATVGSRLQSEMPEWMAMKLLTDSIEDFSRELGHSLSYTLTRGHGRNLNEKQARASDAANVVFSAQRFSKRISAVRGFEGATLDLRRREIIAQGKPIDQYRDIVVTRNPEFNLDTTIFRSVTSWVRREYLEAGLNTQIFWHDRAIERIQHAFVNVPAPPDASRELLAFMHDECQFSMEHADGSVLDHLLFGYQYSAAHYKEQSPRVLLLHSVMGLGTNAFPVKEEQIPRLKSLLDATGNEFMHIEAFPSVLRLLFHGKLLTELLAGKEVLQEISFQRVMAPHKNIKMSAEDFWVQLNFQLMHLVDFLPASNWNDPVVMNDPYLKLFQDLRQYLQQNGRLEAQVGFDAPIQGGPICSFPKATVGSRLQSEMPEWMAMKLLTDSIEDFSRELGHSLSYTLTRGHGRNLHEKQARASDAANVVFSAQRFSKRISAVRGFEGATLDLRRREIIAQGKPIDQYRDIVVTRKPEFNLDATIYRTVTSSVKREYLEAGLNTQIFWHDRAIERIQHAFVNVPAPPDASRELLAFMHDECQFAMEHADGSVLDHLLYGYQHSSAHYKEQSPRVLLLHSVMGL